MKYDSYSQLSLDFENKLLPSPRSKIVKLDIPDAEVLFYPQYFLKEEGEKIFQQLLSETHWQQDKIRCYGKEVSIPRLTAWYGDPEKYYTYSGIVMKPVDWTPVLLYLKNKVEDVAKHSFNSVLLNLYRDGKDSIAWHSDDEPELGTDPVIASLSLGSERKFKLRHRFRPELEKIKLSLGHGSILIMKGKTQAYWHHQVPKTSKPVMPRINLTFRTIK